MNFEGRSMSEKESEETKEVNEAEKSTEQEKSEVDVNDLLKKLEDLEAKTDFYKNESIKNASKYKTLRDEVEQTKEKDLKENGKFEDLYAEEKKRRLKLEEEFSGFKKNTLKRDLKTEVFKKVKDETLTEDILNNSTFKERLSLSDEGQWLGITEGLEAVKSARPNWFKTDPVGQENRRPGTKNSSNEDLTQENYFKELKAAKNQHEFEKVRKKYGKI